MALVTLVPKNGYKEIATVSSVVQNQGNGVIEVEISATLPNSGVTGWKLMQAQIEQFEVPDGSKLYGRATSGESKIKVESVE